ncbi:MAG: hypothetical protein SGPRY_006592, partial [Prymnesium sp.]
MALFFCWIPGALLWTRLADRYGRKPLTIACGWLSLLLSACAALASGYQGFFVWRGALGLALGGQGALAYVWTLEWGARSDASLLTLAGNVSFSLFNLALVAVAAAAEASSLGWRGQQLILCALQALPFALACGVSESALYLQAAGREQEAERALRAALGEDGAARLQGVSISAPPSAPQGARAGGTSWRMLVVALSWFTCNLTFYGLDFSVGACRAEEGCDVYLHAALTAVADIPGYAICFILADLPAVGRRLTL